MTAGNQPSSSGSAGPSSPEIETMWRVFNAAYDTVSQTEPGKARRAGFDAVVSHLFPYVDAFRREEARADKLGAELDELHGGAQAEPERLPTHGNLLAEINKAAHAAGTNAWVRDVLKQAHRAIRLNAPLAAVTPSPGPGEWTPDQFWEYVGGLAGEFEAGQMRDMLAAQGLVLSSTEGKSHG